MVDIHGAVEGVVSEYGFCVESSSIIQNLYGIANKGIVSYPSTDQPIGILPETAYQSYGPISLQNAVLYLYSDGVTESKKENGEMLQEAGLIELIARHRDKHAEERLPIMVDEVLTGTSLHDDLTLLLLEP